MIVFCESGLGLPNSHVASCCADFRAFRSIPLGSRQLRATWLRHGIGQFATAYWQRWFRQNAFHFAAQPPLTIAHDRSPPMGDLHQAAVRLPLALPTERQRMVGPLTFTWPSGNLPLGLPIKSTKALREVSPSHDSDRHRMSILRRCMAKGRAPARCPPSQDRRPRSRRSDAARSPEKPEP